MLQLKFPVAVADIRSCNHLLKDLLDNKTFRDSARHACPFEGTLRLRAFSCTRVAGIAKRSRAVMP